MAQELLLRSHGYQYDHGYVYFAGSRTRVRVEAPGTKGELGNHRFEIGSYASIRCVYGPDVRQDFMSVEGARNLKALTGGDALEAEIKFSNTRLPMKGDKHVLVTTNDVLRFAPGEDIGAWQRRLIMVETKAADFDA